MSTYRLYREARDTAWRALLRLPEKRLPVDAEALARQIGVECHPFPDPAAEPRLSALVARVGRGRCASLRLRGTWHIFLREDALSDAERSFAIAHELGHLLLGHGTRVVSPGVRAFVSRENEGDLMEEPESLEDYAADIFAIRLLAPACVLHELHAEQSGDIMALCGLPPKAAALRAERMQLLNERNAYFSHPLERQVRDAFLPFLRSQSAAGMDALQAPETPALLHPIPEAEKAEARKEGASRYPRWLLPAAIGCALAALLFFLLRS